jgi:hypothetical protein
MADAAPVAVVEVEVEAVEAPSLSSRVDRIDDWMASTADARQESLRDEQYYYGKQYTAEELRALNKRKQPPTVRNLIRGKVNSIRGEEIDKRVDPVAKPRTPKHEDSARAMTDALRFVEEDQQLDEIGGDVMLDLLNAGYGGSIIQSDSDDGYRCTALHIPWKQLAIDPKAHRRDCSDAKWIANIQWFDLDDALEIYPDKAAELEKGCERHFGVGDDTTDDRPKFWFDGKRKRVKICEMYERVGKDWYRSDFTDSIELSEFAPSAYLDPRTGRPWCPIVAIRCYVDDDNMAHGPVRDMISPQDEVNKRYSKWLHQTNTRQVVYEDGSVEDINNALEELARPDGAVKVSPGALQEGRIQINTGADMTNGQVAMLQEAKQALDGVGPASANLPDLPQGASGRAFMARQKSAARANGPVFEIFGKWRLNTYWHIYGCIKQFWTDELWLRVTDEEETAGYRWVGLNRRLTRTQRMQELLQKGVPMPVAFQTAAAQDAQSIMQRVQQMHQFMSEQAMMMGQPPPGGEQHMLAMIAQDPAMQVQIIENDVAEAMVDITITEAPETAVLEDEEFAKLSELFAPTLQARPDLAGLLVKTLIKLSAFRDKREILKEMDKPPNPQQAQQQQMQQQMQMAGAKAQLDVTQSMAQLNKARAAESMAKAQTTGPKAQADIEQSKAQSMLHAASAGEKMSGAFSGGMGPPGGV